MKDTQDSNALLVPSNDVVARAFESTESLIAIIEAVEKECRAEAYTVATAEGRKRIASVAYSISRSKTFVDGVGKSLTDEARKLINEINEKRSIVTDRFDKLRDEIRKPLTDWEEADKRRQDGIKARIGELFGPRPFPAESAALLAIQAEVTAVELDESFAEFVDEAAKAKDAFLRILSVKLQDALQAEAREAELVRLREAEAQRKAQEAEQAKLQAEKDAEIAALKAQLAAATQAPLPEPVGEAQPVQEAPAPVEVASAVVTPLHRAQPFPAQGDNFVTRTVTRAPERQDAANAIYQILKAAESLQTAAHDVASAIWANEIPYVQVAK